MADLSAIRGEGEENLIPNKELGRRLIKLRGNLSRKEVAKALHISLSALTMYENGERTPRDSIKIRIAEFYHRTVQEIFFDKECHI